MNGLYDDDESVTIQSANRPRETTYDAVSVTPKALVYPEDLSFSAVPLITGSEKITAAASIMRYIGVS